MNYFETFKLRQRKVGDANTLASRFLESLAEFVGRPEQFRLVQLWRNWHLVMGEEISSMCLPLGHKNTRLDVGTEDSMAMQELLYLKEEIRLRANSFMEEDFFSEVKLELVAEREGLATTRTIAAKEFYETPRHATGAFLADMPEDDPVARCYRAYCQASPDLDERALSDLDAQSSPAQAPSGTDRDKDVR